VAHSTNLRLAGLIRRVESRLTGASVSAKRACAMPAGVRPVLERDIKPRIVGIEDSAVSLSLTTRLRCAPYFDIQLEFMHTISLEQPVPERELRRAENVRALVEVCLPYHAPILALLCQQMGVPPVVAVPAGEQGGQGSSG
jgi:hypothetical protein